MLNSSIWRLILILPLVALTAGCSVPLPPEAGQTPATATPTPVGPDDIAQPENPPTFVEDNHHAVFLACPGEGLNLLASYEIEPEGISHVVIFHRLNGGTPQTTSAWDESVMAPEGILDALNHFRFLLPSLGQDAADLFGDQAGVFEYRFQAVDNDSYISFWPAPEGALAEFPIEPCPQEAESYSVHDYGVSSTQAGYGPGCSPTELTFEVILTGLGLVGDAWLRYEYLDAGYVMQGQSMEVPLVHTGEGQGYPGSARLAATVDVGAQANGYLTGQDGYLSWNMYVQVSGQQTYEYPLGGPPVVAIESCLEPTPTPLRLIPIFPTSTPTPFFLIIVPTIPSVP
jgi:hypothetical protein